MSGARSRAAVVGAGMAGAACARALADAGFEVRLFDKSRGVGGRMASRPTSWTDEAGGVHRSLLDHGPQAFRARGADFSDFVRQAARDGLLAQWAPRWASPVSAPHAHDDWWLPVPDMPALCRSLLAGLPVQAHCTVDVLQHEADGWCLASDGSVVDRGFDVVVVAIPPPQAAALFRPHRADWAQRALAVPMLPCWALMGVTREDRAVPEWELAWPASGPLATVVRSDARPGRCRAPGFATWVVHATSCWSLAHLELPAADVQARMQDALVALLGASPTWCQATAHRWRYASMPTGSGQGTCWWDPVIGLGACADALGGAGVEGAWRSGRAMAASIASRLT